MGNCQATNASYANRYTGTATSRTFTQESDGTCVRARAAYSRAHADAGAWSGYSASRCATLISPPSVPAIVSGGWTSYQNAGIGMIYVTLSGSASATSYDVQYRFTTNVGDRSTWTNAYGLVPSTGAGQWGTHHLVTNMLPGQEQRVTEVEVRVRSRNAAGASNWSAARTLTDPY